MTTTVNGITFQIEGQSTPTRCCVNQPTDLSHMDGSIYQAHGWTGAFDSYAKDHASMPVLAGLSAVVAIIFAFKRIWRPRLLEPIRRSSVTFTDANWEDPPTEDAARAAFLKRYGGSDHRSLQARGESK